MDYVLAAILGFAGGTVGGLLGVGGGILFVPALAIFLGEPQIRAEATSLLAIVPVALVGAWRQHGYGNVRLRDGFVIGALSPLGVLLGCGRVERRFAAGAGALLRGADPVRRRAALQTWAYKPAATSAPKPAGNVAIRASSDHRSPSAP